MIEEKKQINSKTQFWKSILIIAGIFSFAICILIIGNYFQINKADPVNTKVINSLVERLNQNPDDQALRDEIREFDLLARKAYFTNQWQIRFGGYLLLVGIIIMIISVLMMDSANKKVKAITFTKDEKLPDTQKSARKWISIGGIAIAVITLVFAFLTHQELKNKFRQETIPENIQNNLDSLNQHTVSVQKTLDTLSQKTDTTVADSSNVQVVKNAGYPTPQMKSNFPSFRGPGGNGIAYQKNIPTDWDGASSKNIKWKTAVPLPGYNSPVVWADKVFLSGANGTKQEVYCFSKKSGKIMWTAEVRGVEGSPAKAPKVTDDTGYSASTVTTDGENVYAIFATGDIIAVNMSGKKIWARNLGVPDNHYGHSSSLLMYEDLVIVQYDHKKSASVMALAANNGNIVWSTSRKVKISWASPVIVNTGSRDELLLIAEPFVISYEPKTGKELWKVDCTYGEVGPSVAYANGIVFALNEYAKLVAIKVGNQPKILWENNDYLSDVPSPVATDKYLIVVTSYGEVVCYNPKTGDKYWNHDFGTGTYSSPILVGEKVYLIDKKGIMHIFKADKEFSIISEPKLGENTVCTPAFAEGKIFIRAGNNLYCISK